MTKPEPNRETRRKKAAQKIYNNTTSQTTLESDGNTGLPATEVEATKENKIEAKPNVPVEKISIQQLWSDNKFWIIAISTAVTLTATGIAKYQNIIYDIGSSKDDIKELKTKTEAMGKDVNENKTNIKIIETRLLDLTTLSKQESGTKDAKK